MPANDSLKRLGGGRWATRDGRFAIEPQSGTWVVVDGEQTDELGLPLVRGPFPSLTMARVAIDNVRAAGPVESPLAGRLMEAERARSARPAPTEKPLRAATSATTGAAGGEPGQDGVDEAAPAAAPESAPEARPEPKWLRDLAPANRRRARDLIEELERLGVGDPHALARAEIALDQPALTRLAIERRLREVMAAATDPGDAIRAVADLLVSGRDRELEVRWRLVDVHGRPVTDLDLS